MMKTNVFRLCALLAAVVFSAQAQDKSASHDALSADEIKSLEDSAGIECRMKAHEQLNLSSWDEPDNGTRDAKYVGNNTHTMDSYSTTFDDKKERVDYTCTAVASGDTFIPEWKITIERKK